MEDKNLYNKVMLIAFCLILVLLGAGMYGRRVAKTAGLRELRSQGNRPGSTSGNRVFNRMNVILAYIKNMAPYMAYSG